MGGEELQADFDPRNRAADLAQDRGGGFAVGQVEGEDELHPGHASEQRAPRVGRTLKIEELLKSLPRSS